MYKKALPLLLLAALFLLGIQTVNAKHFGFEPIQDSTKPWVVSFSEAVQERASFDSIYIESSDGIRHDVSYSLSDDLREIIVQPTKRYHLGEEYTIVVPQNLEAKSGKKLKESFSKAFQLQGKYIESIQANANLLVTNVILQGDMKAISHATVSLEDQQFELSFNRNKTHFSRGMQGLIKGDVLIVRAYGEDGLLEEQSFAVK